MSAMPAFLGYIVGILLLPVFFVFLVAAFILLLTLLVLIILGSCIAFCVEPFDRDIFTYLYQLPYGGARKTEPDETNTRQCRDLVRVKPSFREDVNIVEVCEEDGLGSKITVGCDGEACTCNAV